MRARNIKPGFYKNDRLSECSFAARLIFPGLWMMADRAGRLEDRPMKIKGEILPYDAIEIDPLLQELDRVNMIARYSVNGGKYIQILNFAKHQNPHHKESDSVIPPLQEAKPETSPVKVGASPVKEGASQVKASADRADSVFLIPDSLIPDSSGESVPIQKPEDAPAETPPVATASLFDPLKANAIAKRVANAYEKEVGGRGAWTHGFKALVEILEFQPTVTESDLMACVKNYRISSEKNDVVRQFRLGMGNFFAGEWDRYLHGVRSPPKEESSDDLARETAERIARKLRIPANA